MGPERRLSVRTEEVCVSFVKGRLLRAVTAAVALMVTGVTASEAREDVHSYEQQCGTPNLSTGTRICTYRFWHHDAMDPFVVPPTTGPIQIIAVGAPGGEPGFWSRGAKVTGSYSILSGTVLFVTVGGAGFYGGYNGGGEGIDAGGGATDVRLGAIDLKHRIIVAGGGGGAGDQMIFDQERGIWRFITVKGGDAGQPGVAAGGQPGTATAGGAGGGNGSAQGHAGTLGRGGDGADNGGGGGGGGLYGGGGGGACWGGGNNPICPESQPGSGGGGSSLVPPGGTLTLSDVLEPSVTIVVAQYA
jgi:hypothetical protein